MEEVWKEIDDRYSVSNLGRVKSNYANKEKILKPFLNKRGYLMVDIRHPGYRKSISVHRLVATAFIPNPDNLPEVNHKDEIKTNNSVDNLEWCTLQYNCNYGTRNERKGLACRKKIYSIDPDGNIEYFNSRNEAGERLCIDPTSISKALKKNGKNKTAGGRYWFYDDRSHNKTIEDIRELPTIQKKAIYSVDENNNIEFFESQAEARRKTGINNINRALKNRTKAGGKYWFYNK